MHCFLNKTCWELLQDTAARFPEREAITDTVQKISYRELVSRSEAMAAVLLGAGIKRGCRVGTWAGDGADYTVLFFALWAIGAIPVPLCTLYERKELETCIQAAEIEYLLVDPQFPGNRLLDVCREQTKLKPRQIWSLSDSEEAVKEGFRLLSSVSPVEKTALDAAMAQVLPQDHDLILFTSGSTGNAKPVLTTHFSRVNTACINAEVMETGPEDRICSVLPMFHCFYITVNMMVAVSAGACICFPKNYSSEMILKCIESEGCTILTAVPTRFSALLRKQKELQADLHTLRTGLIGGSTYSEEMFCEVCQLFDMTLLPAMGQTEATAGYSYGSLSDSLQLRSTSRGRASDGVEISIQMEGKPVPEGQTGEICVRGFNIMQGYYKDPAATKATVDADGWMHTGDLGYMKGEILYYADRIKELIIRGGENILPGEIEGVLNADERIEQAKVIGVPDPHYIEEVCACVLVKPGCQISEEEVRSLVAENLSRYKVPRYVLFLEEFPLNRIGKIQRDALGRVAIAALGLQ